MNSFIDQNIQNLSIHVHGRKENNTFFLLELLRKFFPKTQILYCTFDKFDNFEKNILKKKNIEHFSLKDIGEYNDFTKANINYLRHNYSCLFSLKKSTKKYSLKIRSDAIINRKIYKDLNFCFSQRKNFSILKHNNLFKNNLKPKKIITHSYFKFYLECFVPDQILFSERKHLLNFYKYGTLVNKRIKLSDLHAIPDKLFSKQRIYLSSEQLQILSYIKNVITDKQIITDLIFDREFNEYLYDNLFISYNFKGIFLPHRIDPRLNIKRYLFEKYKTKNGIFSLMFKYLFCTFYQKK